MSGSGGSQVTMLHKIEAKGAISCASFQGYWEVTSLEIPTGDLASVAFFLFMIVLSDNYPRASSTPSEGLALWKANLIHTYTCEPNYRQEINHFFSVGMELAGSGNNSFRYWLPGR